MVKKMTAALGSAALLTLLAGCGYKAPPYYQKTPTTEASASAL